MSDSYQQRPPIEQLWPLSRPAAPSPTPPARDWLELRARAPMRQPAAKANRRRPRPEQEGLANVPLFDPRLF